MDSKLIFLTISTTLLVWNYIERFRGFRNNSFSMNPLTVAAWIANSVVSLIFLIVSGNFLLSILSSFSLSLELITFFLAILKIRSGKIKKWHITRADYTAFLFAIFSLVIYIFTEDPNLGMVVLFCGSLFGEIPNLRKNYFDPQSDKMRIYVVAALRSFISAGTLERNNLVGALKTFLWGIVITCEALWLLYCRKRIAKKKKSGREFTKKRHPNTQRRIK